MYSLSNKVAVITGGTSGIGLSAVKLFAQAGAKVVVFSRTPARSLSEITASATTTRPHWIQGDIANRSDVQRLMDTCRDVHGGIDVLFANAALVRLGSIADMDAGTFEDVVNTNLKGTYQTLQQAIPLLNQDASVILTTSYFNRIGFPGSSAVSMTKAAIRALVRVAAAELASRRIRVNAISPGAIDTPLWSKLSLPQEVLQSAASSIVAQTPAGRFGTPAEIAQVALFLASDASSYINGTELQADGGLHQV